MSSVPAGDPGPAEVLDRARIEAVLVDTERRLDPTDPGSSGHVRILGYGEVSAALTVAELPGIVCKRMSGFASIDAAGRYMDLVDQYLGELRTAGIRVVATLPLQIRSASGRPAVYLVQPEQPEQTLGHRRLASTDDSELAAMVRGALDSIATLARHTAMRTDGLEVALDGQLSNWAFPLTSTDSDAGTGSRREATPEPQLPQPPAPSPSPTPAPSPTLAPQPIPAPCPTPALFDVGTPFMRRAGEHAMSRAYLLGPVPPLLRTYYGRKGLVEAYLDDYFVPRTVALDLLGNFHKEGHADRLPNAIQVVNEWLADPDVPGPTEPIDAAEVQAYYRKDADLLELYLRLRRMDRFVRTKVLRRPYDYLLPGRVSR